MMRLLALSAVAALCSAAAGDPKMVVVSTNYGKPASAPAAQPATIPPQIVPSVAAATAAAGKHATPKNPNPLPYPNNDEHNWVADMHKLQLQIENHETSLTDLNKQLEEAEKHKQKLLRAQKLLHSMVALHQSETVLHQIDSRMEKIKAAIKKLGEEADELMRGRDELRKELEDDMAAKADALKEMRSKLAQKEALLTALMSKRKEVADTVSEWRDFVGGLRSGAGLPASGDEIRVPKLPRPPSKDEEEGSDEEEEEEAEEGEADGSGSAAEPKKTPVEKVAVPKTPEYEAKVTAKAKDIKATQDSIQELLAVHLPRITGADHAHGSGSGSAAAAAAAPRFAETRSYLRRNRHHDGIP